MCRTKIKAGTCVDGVHHEDVNYVVRAEQIVDDPGCQPDRRNNREVRVSDGAPLETSTFATQNVYEGGGQHQVCRHSQTEFGRHKFLRHTWKRKS